MPCPSPDDQDPPMKYKATVDHRDFTLDVDRPGEIVVDGVGVAVDLMSIDGENLYSLLVDGVSYDLHCLLYTSPSPRD